MAQLIWYIILIKFWAALNKFITAIYFLVLVIFLAFIISNLLLASLVQHFSNIQKKPKKKATKIKRIKFDKKKKQKQQQKNNI